MAIKITKKIYSTSSNNSIITTYKILRRTGIISGQIQNNTIIPNRRNYLRYIFFIVYGVLLTFFTSTAFTQLKFESTQILRILAKFYHFLQIFESFVILFTIIGHERNIYKFWQSLLSTVQFKENASACKIPEASVTGTLVLLTLIFFVNIFFGIRSSIEHILAFNLVFLFKFLITVTTSILFTGMKFKYVVVMNATNELLRHVDNSLKYFSTRNKFKIVNLSNEYQRICNDLKLFNMIMSTFVLAIFCQIFVVLTEEVYLVVSSWYDSKITSDWRRDIILSYYLIIDGLINMLLLLVPTVKCKRTVSKVLFVMESI